MKISDAIAFLQQAQEEHGDLELFEYYSESGEWSISDLTVKKLDKPDTYRSWTDQDNEAMPDTFILVNIYPYD